MVKQSELLWRVSPSSAESLESVAMMVGLGFAGFCKCLEKPRLRHKERVPSQAGV